MKRMKEMKRMKKTGFFENLTTLFFMSFIFFIGFMSLDCGRAATPPASDLPQIVFEKYTLQNGLDVILSEDHRLPLVAVDVWYHVGPANEAEGRTGFAHLFEHMMFQGSKHVPGDSHFQLLEAAGGSNLNGTTDFDRTNYFETLPASQLELGLWLESDRMGYLLDTVDEVKLANQQDVVRNERRQNTENTPYGIVSEALYHTLYPKGHPYYASVIGSHADIQAAKLGDVKSFFKQYYAPNNASLAIVGDIDKARTKQLVEKYFGTLKRGPDVPKITVQTPPITLERRVVVKDRVQLSRVYMAWITPAFFKAGDADADASASILGGGKSSRLYKRLVYEKQIAQDVSAYQQSLALGSAFQIVATVRPGKSIQEVEAAIDDELKRFREAGPDDREIERARNTFETTVIGGLEVLGGFGGVADTLNLFNHYVGDPGYLAKYIDEHRKVTPASVKAFAQQYLQPTARVVVHGVPGEPDPGSPVPTPPAPKVAPGTGAEAVNADELWRKDKPAASDTRVLSVQPARSFTLGNGLTVILQERTGAPIVSASLVVRSGGDANPAGKSGLANFTAAMLDQGTATRNALQVADDVAQIGASLDATSTKDAVTASVRSLKKNFTSTLDLLADVTLRPAFPQAEIDRERASRLAQLVAQQQDPATVGAVATLAALYGPLHPYGYVELGTEVAAKTTSRDDLVAFWTQRFAPANGALVVAGPVTEAELKPLVERAFGAWKGQAAPAPALGAATTTPARIVLVDQPGTPQTQLYVATIGPPRSTPDFAQVGVMNNVLGGLFSSRINMNLREAHGYTYGAFSEFIFRRGPGPFWIQSGVRTDATAPAVAEVLREVKRLASEAPKAEELAVAKDAIVRSLPSAFETSSSTVGTLSALYLYDLGLDYYTRYPAMVSAVTADAVKAAAAKYVPADRLVVIAVGDRKKIEPGLKQLNLGAVEVRDVTGTRAIR
jgi:zinc protease